MIEIPIAMIPGHDDLRRYVLTKDWSVVTITLPYLKYTGTIDTINNELAYFIYGACVRETVYKDYIRTLVFNNKMEQLIYD